MKIAQHFSAGIALNKIIRARDAGGRGSARSVARFAGSVFFGTDPRAEALGYFQFVRYGDKEVTIPT